MLTHHAQALTIRMEPDFSYGKPHINPGSRLNWLDVTCMAKFQLVSGLGIPRSREKGPTASHLTGPFFVGDCLHSPLHDLPPLGNFTETLWQIDHRSLAIGLISPHAKDLTDRPGALAGLEVALGFLTLVLR